MKEIPHGFIKMDLSLTFNKRAAKIVERHVLRMLVRDYYVFYTKYPLSKSKELRDFVRLNFYCREQDAQQIAYLIGIYNQTMLNFHTPEKIELESHAIPKEFPNCIRITGIKNERDRDIDL